MKSSGVDTRLLHGGVVDPVLEGGADARVDVANDVGVGF